MNGKGAPRSCFDKLSTNGYKAIRFTLQQERGAAASAANRESSIPFTLRTCGKLRQAKLSANGILTSRTIPRGDLFRNFLGGIGKDFRQGGVVMRNPHEVLGSGAVVERHDALVD